jgi:Calcineurin-like phosphoesterase
MILCAAGDIHGALDQMYQDVLKFEQALDIRFDWILHVGDFGIWPDPFTVDRATRDHEGAGNFPQWHQERRRAPRKTLFIKGNHEDFQWLDSRPSREVLPDLFYLPNGAAIEISAESEKGCLRVAGIGGCYGPSDYERKSKSL